VSLAHEADVFAAAGARWNNKAPARFFQGGVDQLGAGFGLVHGLVRACSAA
jgi:hypothetical protein